MTPPLVVLCCHRILPAARHQGPDKPYFLRQTALSVECFRTLLDRIEAHATILPPEALLEWPNYVQKTEGPGVVLTFDDGYADFVTFALPELQRRHLRAVMCITTATFLEDYVLPVDRWYAAIQTATVRQGTLIGMGEEPWTFDLNRADDFARWIDGPEKRRFVQADGTEQDRLLGCIERTLGVGKPTSLPKMLDVEQLQKLEADGVVLGAHGHHHVHLPRLSPGTMSYELERCYSFFMAHGLSAPQILAYPDGATCETTEALAEAQGFTVGLALGSRAVTAEDTRMHLPRLIPTNDPHWFDRRLRPIFT